MATWAQNRDFILRKVSEGTATAGQQAWYDRYIASGSPASQSGMLTKEQYENLVSGNNVQMGMGDDGGQATVTPPAATVTPPAVPTVPTAPVGVTGGGYTADAPLHMNEADWTRNRDFIIRQVQSGQATPNQQYWFDTWLEAGRPNPFDSVSQPPVSEPPVGQPPVTQPPITAPPLPNDRLDLPLPEGGPVTPWVPGENVDTSWDWDAFAPKRVGDGAWGGYDQDYQAFERYQPGMDSPWGMPDVRGGNEAFYQQQFVNMLRDEQGYRNRQREAQRLAQEAAENPIQATPIDWSWAYGGRGLPTVVEGTGQQAPTGFAFNEQYAGQTGADLWGQFRDRDVFTAPNESSRTTRDVLNNLFNDPNRAQYLQVDWSQFANPDAAYQAIDPAAFQGMNRPNVAQQGVRTLLNQIYDVTGTGGPTAPSGYASPINR